MDTSSQNELKAFSRRNLLYCSTFFWKKIYVFKILPILTVYPGHIYYRSSIIPRVMRGSKIKIHTGKKWRMRFVRKWMIGYKIGEFTWNRRYAIYKAKQMRKKNKKKK